MKTQFYTASDEIKSNVFVVKQSSKERPMAGLGPDSGAKGSSLFQVGGGWLSLSYLCLSSFFLIGLINDARCPTFMNLGNNCRMYPRGLVLLRRTDYCATHVEIVNGSCL